MVSILCLNGVTVDVTAEVELPQPIAEYTFSGSIFDDTSGNRYNGTSDKPPTLTADRFGNEDSAVHFDGSQYINFGEFNDIDGTGRSLGEGPCTVAFWFKADDLSSSFYNILTKSDKRICPTTWTIWLWVCHERKTNRKWRSAGCIPGQRYS